MNPRDQNVWKSEALDHVFRALASSPELADKLVYKGARVLALHLGATRQSFDIDSTLTTSYVAAMPDVGAQVAYLEHSLRVAIGNYFNRQDPVRFTLTGLKVISKPHPRGWDALRIAVNVEDNRRAQQRFLPQLSIDVSAPEDLLPGSVVEIPLNGERLRAYSLQRIAGEKLRAYLSTLPTYCKKVLRPTENIRVRDLYDLTTILNERPISDVQFWREVAQEFFIASCSRAVDCSGLSSFMESWEQARAMYETSGVIPKSITFAQVEQAIRVIVAFLETELSFPLVFPLPPRRQ